MSTQDCLQHLCDEAPDFSLYYQEFLAFYSRPAAECRIVICGLSNAGKSALASSLALSQPLPATGLISTEATIVPLYIDTPGFDADVQQTAGAWETAIGADIIVLAHDVRSGALTDVEIAFLTALRGRFPDLSQRMIVALSNGDNAAHPRLERLSAIHRNLATLFSSPAHLYSRGDDAGPTLNRVPVLLLEPSRAPSLQQQILLLIGSYDGGLTGMRTASIKAVLDRLDMWVAGAIKIRKKRVAAGEAELSRTFTLWQKDLQRLGETLRFRIDDIGQR
ncbi:hypothetical protein ABK905_06600 [Acerihabitans sp. KWT182]|uniref:G domain-containing protein n=1 Tax=Acerihabitans sp. KWT182 TaxID=3157919 RepID=A0AAU7QDQ0_9GAMM